MSVGSYRGSDGKEHILPDVIGMSYGTDPYHGMKAYFEAMLEAGIPVTEDRVREMLRIVEIRTVNLAEASGL